MTDEQLEVLLARAEEAEGELAARIKQCVTQAEIHNRNTREWRVALDESAAHVERLRGALEALLRQGDPGIHPTRCGVWDTRIKPHCTCGSHRIAKMAAAALAATPAQSLVRVRIHTLEDMAAKYGVPDSQFPQVAAAARHEIALLERAAAKALLVATTRKETP